ncbi:phage head morphogenesis protein [Blastomonas fulva]|uniref:phage head morphogenesis protein n=1 Tax=Blastomonas fulva TaxID=1550728 RepID=UPI0025A32783|nr:phage minor head protein [Blastomonas fulva]MDM7928672.1 phage minor head protein [Blastomonas fulva]MDM7964458.1 phage minor head protein [Blastomonas fulva]
MAEDTPPQLLPEEAIAFFRAKGIAFGFDWRDVWQEEHAKAFTVAKAMSRDLVEDIRQAVDDAITKGTTLATFRQELTPLLMARGWWGRSLETDPLTGEQRVVQLGSPARLRTIFDTNLRSAYAAGRWERIERQKKVFPFLIYESVKDGRERPEHGAWHKTILPVDHPWWDTHYPPCGWNCRCTARPVNQRMLDRRGETVTEQPVRFPARDYVNRRTGEITRTERGIDPGFSFNVGKAYLDPLAPKPMPGAPGEADATAAADLSGDAERVLKRLLRPFEIDARQLQRGAIWRDATGWPLAIGAGLFRDARGDMQLPNGSQLRRYEQGFRALGDPDSIRLVWVLDRAGRAMLMRRYIQGNVAFDIGRAGWRTARLRNPGGGKQIWQR